jgi:hypothetical protein
VLAGGCSAGGGGSGFASAAEAKLQADVLSLSQSAAGHDWAAARKALAQLRSDASAAVASGELSAARAQTIRDHAAAVAADLPAAPSSSSPPPPPPPPRTRTRTPAPKPAPVHHPGHGKHKGKHGGGED